MIEIRDFNISDIQEGYSDVNTFILDNCKNKKDEIQILFKSNKDILNNLSFNPNYGYRGVWMNKYNRIYSNNTLIDMNSVICIKSIE